MKTLSTVVIVSVALMTVIVIGMEIFVHLFNPTMPSLRRRLFTLDDHLCESPLHVQHVTDESSQNWFHFVQLSDIHISHTNRRQYRSERLAQVAHDILPNVIQPRFVIVTGDLTHGSYPQNMRDQDYVKHTWLDRKLNLHRPQQNAAEWKNYSQIAQEGNQLLSNALKKNVHYSGSDLSLRTVDGRSLPLDDVVWFDCPGNHDRFNVPDLSDLSVNLYATHSCCLPNQLKSQSGNRTFEFTLETQFGTYEFISIDATPDHGGFAPFNFFGIVKRSAMDELEKKLQYATTKNLTVVFGHYPQSIIQFEKSSSGLSIRDLSLKYPYAAYLSGHLHNLYNRAWNLKERAPAVVGHYEWEIPDFKEHNIMRILAVDQDTISYLDLPYDKWPKALITHPATMNCQCKPVQDEIRFLLFTQSTIKTIEITIDGKQDASIRSQLQDTIVNNQKSGEKMYRIKFNPLEYATGMHHIHMVVTDEHNTRHFDHAFSLDGSNCHHKDLMKNFIARFVLFTEFQRLLPFAFYFCMIVAITALAVLRRVAPQDIGQEDDFSLRAGLWRVVKSKYWYFYQFYCFYMPLGPLFAGEIATDEYALFFEWGIYYLGFGKVSQQAIVTPDIHFNVLVPLLIWVFCPLFAVLVFTRSFPAHKPRKVQLAALALYSYIVFKRFRGFYHIFVRTYGRFALLFAPAGIWLYMIVLLLLFYESLNTVRALYLRTVIPSNKKQD